MYKIDTWAFTAGCLKYYLPYLPIHVIKL